MDYISVLFYGISCRLILLVIFLSSKMTASERDWMKSPSPTSSFLKSAQTWSVTRWLITLNIAIFALGFFWKLPYSDGIESGMAVPMYYGYYSVDMAWTQGEFWRLITYQFLHASVGHLLFNMIALYYFGSLMENIMGRKRYLFFYLLCGIAGALFSSILASFGLFEKGEMFNYWNYVPMVGASGSIYGILAAGAVVFPATRVRLILPPVEMSMRTLVLCLLGLAVLFIVFGWENAGGEAGHLGGMIMGFLLIQLPFFRRHAPADRRPRRKTSSPNQSGSEKTDQLLEKISKEGLHSLTDKERAFLLSYSNQEKNKHE